MCPFQKTTFVALVTARRMMPDVVISWNFRAVALPTMMILAKKLVLMILCHMVIKLFGGLEFKFTQYTLPGHTPQTSDLIFTFLDNFNSWFMLTFSPFTFWFRLMFRGEGRGKGRVVFTSPMDLVTCLFGSIPSGTSCSFTLLLTWIGVDFEGMGVVSLNDDFPRYTTTMSTENTSQSMTQVCIAQNKKNVNLVVHWLINLVIQWLINLVIHWLINLVIHTLAD